MKFPKMFLVVFITVCLSVTLFAEKKHYIVKLDHDKPHAIGKNYPGFGKLKQTLKDSGIKLRGIKDVLLLNSFEIEMDEEDVEKLKELDIVISVEEQELNFPDVEEAVPQIKGPEAHNLGFTGAGVSVGVIGTGVDYNHPEIINNYKGGYDFAHDDNDPMDYASSGHETHVSGTVIAVAPDVDIYALKVFPDGGGGAWSSNIIAAIQWGLDPDGDGDFSDHLDILTMSLSGGGYPNDSKCQAVKMANDWGVVVTVSAGNSGNVPFATARTPAACWESIGVGANTKSSDPEMAWFSSFGPAIYQDKDLMKPDITAPGVSICAAKSANSTRSECSTDPSRSSLSGTSMSCPMLAGSAALAIQSHPSYMPEQIKRLLKASVTDLGFGYDAQGAGEVDLLKVVQGTDPGLSSITFNPTGRWFNGAKEGDLLEETVMVTGGTPVIQTTGFMSVSSISEGQFTATINVPNGIADGIYISRAIADVQTRYTGVFIKDGIAPEVILTMAPQQESPYSYSVKVTDNLCLISTRLNIPSKTGNMLKVTYILNYGFYCNPPYSIDHEKCFQQKCSKSKTISFSKGEAPDGSYVVTVDAYDTAGNVTHLEAPLTIGPVTSAPPAAPTNLTVVEIEGGDATLHWDDNSFDEDGFKVNRNGMEIGIASVNSVQFTDQNVDCEQSYSYKVLAYNEIGESDYSNEVPITMGDCPPPVDTEPPTVTITSPANGSIVARKSSFVVSADAWDNVGVDRVLFYLDGRRICTDTTAEPHECTMGAAPKPNKRMNVQAVAIDEAGNNTGALIQVTTSKGGKPK